MFFTCYCSKMASKIGDISKFTKELDIFTKWTQYTFHENWLHQENFSNLRNSKPPSKKSKFHISVSWSQFKKKNQFAMTDPVEQTIQNQMKFQHRNGILPQFMRRMELRQMDQEMGLPKIGKNQLMTGNKITKTNISELELQHKKFSVHEKKY